MLFTSKDRETHDGVNNITTWDREGVVINKHSLFADDHIYVFMFDTAS